MQPATTESEEIMAQPSASIVELEPCEKCGTEVSPFEMPEHLDYHLAKELQAELRRQESAAAPAQNCSNNQISSTKVSKRKCQSSVAEKLDPKRQKKISSFFDKK